MNTGKVTESFFAKMFKTSQGIKTFLAENKILFLCEKKFTGLPS